MTVDKIISLRYGLAFSHVLIRLKIIKLLALNVGLDEFVLDKSLLWLPL